MITTPEELSKLLSRIALKDRQAFDRLYQNTSAKLFGVVVRILKDQSEAEEVLQEVFVKIWNRASRYAISDASAMSWLIAVARNCAIDNLRNKKGGHQNIDDEKPIIDAAPSPEATAIIRSEFARIEECLEQLEEAKAATVRGAYLEGYSYQELADQLKIPLNTMRTWLRRSMAKLRVCLES